MTTPILSIPELAAAQAQPEVIVNGALRRLEVLVQLAVTDKDVGTPPGSPAEGARYIVGPSPTGAWAGKAGQLAAFSNGAWVFSVPTEGWLAWVKDEDALYVHDGSAWTEFAGGGGGGVSDGPYFVVVSRVTDEPGSPVEGQFYLVLPGATGAFASQDGKIAKRIAGSWTFLIPTSGWLAYSQFDDEFYLFDGSAWPVWSVGGGGGGTGVADPGNAIDIPPNPDFVGGFLASGFDAHTDSGGTVASVASAGGPYSGSPGIVELDSGSSAGGLAGIALAPDAGVAHAAVQTSALDGFTLDARVYVYTPGGGDEFNVMVGLLPNVVATNPANGLYFYTEDVAGTLVWGVHEGNFGSDTPSAVAVSNGWAHLRIARAPGSSDVVFSVDGVDIATVSADGTGTLAAAVARGTVGGLVAVDALRLQGAFSTARW